MNSTPKMKSVSVQSGKVQEIAKVKLSLGVEMVSTQILDGNCKKYWKLRVTRNYEIYAINQENDLEKWGDEMKKMKKKHK